MAEADDGRVAAVTGSAPEAVPIPGTVPIIEGERVRLRPIRVEDIDAIVVNCRDPLTQRFVPVPIEYGPEDARAFVEDRVPAGWRDGTAHEFAVAAAENAAENAAMSAAEGDTDDATTDDALLGTVGLHAFRASTADVGITIGPASRRSGIGEAAAELILDYAFDGLGLTTLYWQAMVGNDASRALAERLGFRFLAELPAFADHRGVPVDVWMFVLTAADRSNRHRAQSDDGPQRTA